MFFLSLFAEFLANDKPILIRYDGAFYSPIFRDYPETTFGGDLPTNAVYTDTEIQHLIDAKGWMLWPLIPYRYDTRASGEQRRRWRSCRRRWNIRSAPTTRRATCWRG